MEFIFVRTEYDRDALINYGCQQLYCGPAGWWMFLNDPSIDIDFSSMRGDYVVSNTMYF